MDMREIERIERLHYSVVCDASDTAGRSLVENIDDLVRNSSRAISAAKTAVRENIELRAQVASLQQMAGARARLHVVLPANA